MRKDRERIISMFKFIYWSIKMLTRRAHVLLYFVYHRIDDVPNSVTNEITALVIQY